MAFQEKLNARYILAGKEVGEQCGTPHVQGYCEFLKETGCKATCKLLGGRARMYQAHGTAGHNFTYCTKEDKNAYEWGKPAKDRAKGGAEAAYVLLNATKEGVSRRQMYEEEMITSASQIKLADDMCRMFEPKRTKKTFVTYIWGPPGFGKSYLARKLAGDDAYWKYGSTGKWWNDYDGHKNVIMDDIRGSHRPFDDLILFMDENPKTVETKGGTRQFVAENLFITTIYPPERLYKGHTDEPLEQLYRRIDKTIHVEVPWNGTGDRVIIDRSPAKVHFKE